jgi:protein gp37
VFVDSMSDLFHNDVDDFFIGEVFGVMRAARQHQFQLLTKRSARMAKLLSKFAVPENVWIGVSVESSQYLSRVDDLLQVDARVRFLSIEPLIAPVGQLPLQNIHWVIVGGESGPRARPMNPLWATSVRDQCVAAAVPFFFKQWGGVHKGANGRVLDGRTWDEFPALRAQAPARRHLTVLGGAR